MIVNELAEIDELESVLLTDPERSVQGAYAGDLLSWVMGRAEADNAVVTIMTNVNVVAVAALAELSCVIFAEHVEIPPEVVAAAEQKGINLLRSRLPTYETCCLLGRKGI